MATGCPHIQLQQTCGIDNVDILADILDGFDWAEIPKSPECRAYSWLSETFELFSFSALIPFGGGASFRINPQGLASDGKDLKSKDAPDFTFLITRRNRPDFQLGWLEEKVSRGLSFFGVFVDCYAQFSRYAQGMLLANPQLHRIRTIVSCQNQFALLEWQRPREIERESPPPTSPGLPDWVSHEQNFYKELDDLVLDLNHDPTYAYFLNKDRESLPAEIQTALDRCEKVLADVVQWNPVVIFFGENIFDRDSSCLSSAFRHSLQLLCTPYEGALEGDALGLPIPLWNRLQGSIFERSENEPIPTDESLALGRQARAQGRRNLFNSAISNMTRWYDPESTSATTASTASFVPITGPHPHEVLMRQCCEENSWPRAVTIAVLIEFLDEVDVEWKDRERRAVYIDQVKNWVLHHP
ncbi:hypothetical protein PENSPDRAFT_658409 [Peniophora sp. CONT]|nr:hypothetical protein PENSPDRAFT_658409 [Peniophora sp. CONT]